MFWFVPNFQNVGDVTMAHKGNNSQRLEIVGLPGAVRFSQFLDCAPMHQSVECSNKLPEFVYRL